MMCIFYSFSWWDSLRKALGATWPSYGNSGVACALKCFLSTVGFLLKCKDHLKVPLRIPVLPGALSGSSKLMQLFIYKSSTNLFSNLQSTYLPTYSLTELLWSTCVSLCAVHCGYMVPVLLGLII